MYDREGAIIFRLNCSASPLVCEIYLVVSTSFVLAMLQTSMKNLEVN